MDHRLGRDAPTVQARSAHFPILDDRSLKAKFCRLDCRHIAARSCSDYNQIKLSFHLPFLFFHPFSDIFHHLLFLRISRPVQTKFNADAAALKADSSQIFWQRLDQSGF